MDSKNEKVLNQNGKLPLREKHIYIYGDKCGDWRKQRSKLNVNTEQREEMKLE